MTLHDHLEIIRYFEKRHKHVKKYTVTHSKRRRTLIQFGSNSTRIYKIIDNKVKCVGRN